MAPTANAVVPAALARAAASDAASGDSCFRMELARLDVLLARLLDRLRQRGRSPIADPLLGAGIAEGEAAGLVGELLAEHAGSKLSSRDDRMATAALHEIRWPPLADACRVFGLDAFEAGVLLLGVAVEIDDRYARLVAFLNDHAAMLRPTVGLLTALFDRRADGWRSFLPSARLLRFALVSIDGDAPLSGQSVSVAAAVWPRLLGLAVEPPSGTTLLRQASGQPTLGELVLPGPARARALALARWAATEPRSVVLINGERGRGCTSLAIATAAAARPDSPVLVIDAEAFTTAGPQALLREAVWADATVVVRGTGGSPGKAEKALLRELALPVVWTSSNPATEPFAEETGRMVAGMTLPPADVELRTAILDQLLGDRAIEARAEILALAGRFSFGPGRWQLALRLARERATAERGAGAPLSSQDVARECRTLPEVEMGSLAQRLQSPFTLDDVVVPASTRAELDLALAWMRQMVRVLREWGLGRKAITSGGMACLFFGPPGTGKTMAAQALANALELDLYRIDLSQVVSKYIGETEKNLAAIFSAAEDANAVLFFDEADALFGKRTEVTDAHDRFANIETGFLLQRIELHRGVTILATNLRQNLDDAFVRRMAIVAEFPAPGPEERQLIWQHHLPAPERRAPDVSCSEFARTFALTGGEIRNIVLTASFLAADEGTLLAMPHLARALHRELRKAGRLADPAAFGRWRDALADRERSA